MSVISFRADLLSSNKLRDKLVNLVTVVIVSVVDGDSVISEGNSSIK